MKSEVFLLDCMEGMKQYPDKYFDLAVVDPPYGIDAANDGRFGKKASVNSAAITKKYAKKDWDLYVPTKDYWDESFRVSKERIVWGVNYFFDERLCGGRVFWDKGVPEDYSKSKGEIAYKSFGVSVDYVEVIWHGMIQHNMKNKEQRIHPTQKPVALYDWIYAKYLPQGGKVLDTHLGSGSNRIAADKAGNIEFTAFEIDKDYFEAQEERFRLYKSQLKLAI